MFEEERGHEIRAFYSSPLLAITNYVQYANTCVGTVKPEIESKLPLTLIACNSKYWIGVEASVLGLLQAIECHSVYCGQRVSIKGAGQGE
jgi:hypothetical protein